MTKIIVAWIVGGFFVGLALGAAFALISTVVLLLAWALDAVKGLTK